MNTPFKRPGICSVLNAFSIVAGIVAALSVAGSVNVGASTSTGMIAVWVLAAVIVALIAATPFRVASLVIEYLAKIEWRLERAEGRAEGKAQVSEVVERTVTTPQPPPAPEYFYSNHGEEAGPYHLGQMRAMVTAGAIMPDTPVYRRGDGEWKTARDLEELR